MNDLEPRVSWLLAILLAVCSIAAFLCAERIAKLRRLKRSLALRDHEGRLP